MEVEIPNLLIAISTWLHTFATIVMVGYFFFTGLIYLPVLERRLQPDALRETLENVSAHLRLYYAGSVLIFLASGIYLMLINQDYLGLGKFFANTWSILIVIKHVLVLGFLALAMFSERVFLRNISDQKPKALVYFKRVSGINTIAGLVIILLTSFAKAGL